MFVFQKNKLYAQIDDSLVGVTVSPTGEITRTKDTATYFDGVVLTLAEVYSRFGVTTDTKDGEVVDAGTEVGLTSTTGKRRGRPAKNSV